MRDLDNLFAALERSAFRKRQQLADRDAALLDAKTRAQIVQHARKIVRQRLAAADPANDGKQTPWRGHPVFTAQHATATCCRKCLAKWHYIPAGVDLSKPQIDYIVQVLSRWLDKQWGRPFGNESADVRRQRSLFELED